MHSAQPTVSPDSSPASGVGDGHRYLPRWLIPWLSSLSLITGISPTVTGCGDDYQQPAAGVSNSSASSRRSAQRKQTAAKNQNTLQFYPKIESFVADPDEAETMRHPFEPRDFEVDYQSEESRDPFRSYVVDVNPTTTPTDGSSKPSEECSDENTKAGSYSLRDLELIGIVLRGTRSYAQFRDRSGKGHIVLRNDCLSQEKARVTSIGTGFVSLRMVPEGVAWIRMYKGWNGRSNFIQKSWIWLNRCNDTGR